MTSPRRPRSAGGRRPAAGARRSSTSRTASRPVRSRAPRTAASAGAARPASPLTTRAAILGLVVFTLVFSAVLPLKTFLEQRGEIGEMERSQAAARERVAELERERDQLEDPAFIATEARRRLNYARPGEITYTLIDPQPEPAAEEQATGDPDAPWWSQVLTSVDVADRGAPAEDAAPAVP